MAESMLLSGRFPIAGKACANVERHCDLCLSLLSFCILSVFRKASTASAKVIERAAAMQPAATASARASIRTIEH
jgi:hypothetical protein